MVIWVFAGGGESEVKGLIPFLRKTFPGFEFERKTPFRQKQGPKPNREMSYGRTGQSLIAQIKEQLPIALQGDTNQCDLILVFDDLDCRDPEEQKAKFLEAISTISICENIPKFVGFAAPELEAWLIADWDNSIAKHSDFRGRHEGMRWRLSQKNIPFDRPESFSEYDKGKDSCRDKLSDALIDSTQDKIPRFSKSSHTPLLLLKLDPNVVQQKCPLFRKLYNYLNDFCSLNPHSADEIHVN